MSRAVAVFAVLREIRACESFERKLAALRPDERERHEYAADVLKALREGLEAKVNGRTE